MKAAIFDMDGTLLDSMGMWHGFAPDFCEKNAIAWTKQLAADLLGMEFPEAADYFSEKFPQLGMTPEDLVSIWSDMVSFSYFNEISPKPFAVEFIKRLNENNIPCAVATMAKHALTDAVLKLHGISPLVQVVLTPEDVGGVGKERPDIYLEAARRLGVTAAECVVFEDTLHAIETALSAGFTVWAIDEPFQPGRHDIKASCHRYIHSFKELLHD